ncbi:hypothetical protein [Mycobacterium sp. SMC-15]|uniref:hypothetical protein n=1 Tax=Mycobacterium sp. SMC-15 TaxID=3381627 RepID=UPI0038778725
MRSTLRAAAEVVRAADEFSSEAPEINWETIGHTLAEMSSHGVADEYPAMLSVVYSAPAASEPKPLEAVAKLSGKSPAAIKNHLWRAAREGLLERSPGRAGGAFTQKAVDLLTET